MSNPPKDFNTDGSFNKFKGTYFNNDIDVSSGNIISRTGNLYLAPNSSIYTSDNQIQFNEEFQFTDFVNNVNILGQLKNTYNSIEYDVGLQCEKVDTLVTDVGTISPIVYDTAFKCTNFYYDQASNSTVWSGLLTCPISSIASTAIANTTRFIEGTGNQNVGGIKRFTSNIRIDAGMQLSAGTITLTNAQLQAIPDISTLKTITTAISYTPATVTTVISNVLQFTGTLNGWNTTNFSNAINYSKDFTSSGQSQLTTLSTNLSTANTNIGTLTTKLTDLTYTSGTTTTNIANNTTLANVSFTGNINTYTKAQFDNSINYGKDFTSSGQSQINSLQSSITTINTNLSGYASLSADNTFLSPINTFNNTLNLNGSLKINNTLIVPQSTLLKLEFLQNVSSDIQNQINNINAVSLSASNVFTALNRFSNNIRLDGSLIVNNNTTTLTNDNLNRIQWLSGVSSSVSTSITNLNTSVSTLNTKTTKMSYMSVGGVNTTTILDGLISQTLSFTNTINNISTTTFGYISGLTGNIQTALNSLSTRIATVELVGTIIMSPLLDLQTTTSNKYLMCNGQLVSRTTYSALFTKFGELFSAGDGSTTFGVPNYNGMFLRGMGNQIINGVNYGNYNSTYAPDQDSIQNHTHSGQSGSFLGTVNINVAPSYNSGSGSSPNAYTFSNTGQMATGRINDFETKPVSIGIYYYVRS